MKQLLKRFLDWLFYDPWVEGLYGFFDEEQSDEEG
jgi:hypothetical protein